MNSLIEPAFWAFEFVLVSVLLLGAYRLRPRLGMSAVVAVVVSLQFIQALLASSFYWEVAEGLLVTPGSAILFSSNLALLLYAFSRNGIATARVILYAIIIGNIVPHLVGGVMYAHILYSDPHNFLGLPESIFYQGIWASVVGVAVLYVDQLLALVGFFWLTRRFPAVPVAIPMALVLMSVLAFDTVVYLTIVHSGQEAYASMLVSGVIAKSLGGLAFGLVWGVYMQRQMVHHTGDVKQILKYVFFRDDVEKLREAASQDSLTGLFNRRTFEQVVGELFTREKTDFTLVLCDVDRFKQVNDNLGHQVGDEVLKQIATHIQESTRKMDFAFRIGGDEFAVLLPGCDTESAMEVAQRMSKFRFDDDALDDPVTLTLGLATYPEDGERLEVLYSCADQRLYRGKKEGRAAVVASQPASK